MDIEKTRAVLALIVVVGFILITGFLAIYPFFSYTAVTMDSYSNYLGKSVSIYTSIIGVIIGYYFGKSDKEKNKEG